MHAVNRIQDQEPLEALLASNGTLRSLNINRELCLRSVHVRAIGSKLNAEFYALRAFQIICYPLRNCSSCS